MKGKKGELVLYGIDSINSKMDNIIETLNLKDQHFEIKLVISEAVNNAFVHGNKSDKNKPIHVKWEMEENNFILKVTDCGTGINDLNITREIDEKNILDESGRGLFLINCYADEVKCVDNSIIVKKYIM
ncbi:ATP-binding protein [Clostridium saccharobutylicum]|uniref:ATP-binding region ATPase domain protein n=1 Tax=Clostridium saccharobutylicum DSM 13864 TaxID=1345695 RepID=U5MTS6_CLOSA|nr:ATP-binding protein [Clostridium saccharobutylicum]AGX43061.1 ATP-binding region ATPase domain protein [Clostridium saccharobutylicum DSM 13864]AQR90352.1 anti-sigma F factor [Clostridium saccharobutylicum]AQS00258.1 anti-sigma F factor [Clostridium saccharobutylicum]AQS14241.1 anti-sigma F factor [Clostridium saccharobutylicum]MBA2907601.1 serine/threonine-protein kinase RsbW [Clostridium saccharobutylicum]